MFHLIKKITPHSDIKRKCFSILITAAIAGILTILGIYSIGEYGIALFVLTPLFIGACSTILYGIKKPITKAESIQISILTLSTYLIGLVAFAIEGLICIAMVLPLAFILTWIGSVIGFSLINKKPNKAPMAMLILIVAIPSVALVEKEQSPELTAVVTSIEIKADLETVWENVIQFPELDRPTEFIFKTGIAYPINAKIEGQGVGSIRYCNFTTGSFVEPITIWDAPHLLKFDVLEQPEPMKEIGFWDVDAPHLHDYFVSKEGQFKLTLLPNGNTLLEGTTWYYHRIKPAFYWQLWSKEIIHQIHNRVLIHIKKNAEKGVETTL